MKRSSRNDSSVARELTGLLKKCRIKEFNLDPEKRVLHIKYKEDFDVIFPKLRAEPKVSNPKEYGAPYGAGNVAFFDYNDWYISGDITSHKQNK